MNQGNRQLSERLRTAFLTEMSNATRSDQLAAISSALKEQPSRAPTVLPFLASWRRQMAAIVATATIFTPAAVAVAAEGTLPGDPLYAVKQVTEDLRSVIDPTIAARHRIDEAHRMYETGFPVDEIETVLSEADHAIAKAGIPEDLRTRYMQVSESMGMDRVVGATSSGDSGYSDTKESEYHGQDTSTDSDTMDDDPDHRDVVGDSTQSEGTADSVSRTTMVMDDSSSPTTTTWDTESTTWDTEPGSSHDYDGDTRHDADSRGGWTP